MYRYFCPLLFGFWTGGIAVLLPNFNFPSASALAKCRSQADCHEGWYRFHLRSETHPFISLFRLISFLKMWARNIKWFNRKFRVTEPHKSTLLRFCCRAEDEVTVALARNPQETKEWPVYFSPQRKREPTNHIAHSAVDMQGLKRKDSGTAEIVVISKATDSLEMSFIIWLSADTVRHGDNGGKLCTRSAENGELPAAWREICTRCPHLSADILICTLLSSLHHSHLERSSSLISVGPHYITQIDYDIQNTAHPSVRMHEVWKRLTGT